MFWIYCDGYLENRHGGHFSRRQRFMDLHLLQKCSTYIGGVCQLLL